MSLFSASVHLFLFRQHAHLSRSLPDRDLKVIVLKTFNKLGKRVDEHSENFNKEMKHSMDVPKWSKLGRERQMLYDIPYMCDLKIIQINLLAKQTQGN